MAYWNVNLGFLRVFAWSKDFVPSLMKLTKLEFGSDFMDCL